jgi:CheY-like chemotaxis protein
VSNPEQESTHPTVLLIEDNPNNARLMTRVLERDQYKVLHAEDGETGLMMALSMNPDIILLDLGLPDVDGQTIAAFLKQTPDLPQIPLVIVTAWPAETAREMVTAYGCQGFIAKPIDTREFAQQVGAYLAGLSK